MDFFWKYKLAGCPERALEDEDRKVRREAESYFKAKELLKEYPNLEDMPPLLTSENKFLKLYAETRLNKGV